MQWADTLAERLDRLLRDGGLPAKALSAPMLRRLRPLVETRAIVEHRAGSGARWRLDNREALERFIAGHYPYGLKTRVIDGVVQAPIAFISYSHDSDQHKAEVLDLAQRLRRDGIDARIDRLVLSPPDGWPLWMEKQLKRADFVLVVCSEIYRRRFDDEEAAGKGRGAIWEGRLIRKLIYEDSGNNHRVIPLLIRSDGRVPFLLRDSTYYHLPAEYDALYGRLSGQEQVTPVPIGQIRRLPSRPEVTAVSSGFAPDEVAQPVCPSEAAAALTSELASLVARREEALIARQNVGVLTRRILELRRNLRDGGQLQAGDQLGEERYRLIERIGFGGYASVWKAFDRALQRIVAIKALHPQHGDERIRRERFCRGARAMTKLEHPGIVRVLREAEKDGRFWFFAMEYVDGGDFQAAVLAHRLRRDAMVRVICEAGTALHHAHQAGMVHRDVKPANIVLGPGGQAKLTDFDLVRASDTTGGTGATSLGTFIYAAPETLQSAELADARSDVFSLGMTLVFALHGAELPPAALRSPDQFLPAGLPGAVAAVALKAVQWDPAARFPSAAEFVSALKGASVELMDAPTNTTCQ